MRMKPLAYLLALSTLSLAAQDVVRLGNLKFAHYGAVSYMKELAPKYNLKIDERMFAKGIDINPAIVAGEIDASAAALDAAIAGRAAGVPIYVVAGFARGGARIVVGANSGIRSLKELKGKKVGVARGGAQEVLLLAELAKAGLTWSDKPGKDVLVLYLPFADLNQALMAKNIDAMCQSEPYSSQAINRKFGVELLKPYDTPIGEPIRALVITEKLYKERRDVARRFLLCFVEATKKFIDDPKLAEKYVRENMFKNQISSEDYLDAIGNSPFSYDITTEHVQITTDLMAKYGVGKMAKPPKATDWVKLDLLADAKKQLKIDQPKAAAPKKAAPAKKVKKG
ncbi:ABC transporter substrate-binding protein [Geothrix fuzhouensis]|uniref:ABC transporter substrate-binding protein n=1 Tax=Geothrix fuzhouensis TaxID=2966451 RepID=UPI002148F4BB|nr:ABC transporter substrate-binding protein [Geothrix fuzhouensis]